MNVSSIVKKGLPSVEPHELTPLTDPADPLFDARIHLPISDEALINFAAVGQVQPLAVRPRGFDEMVIVDGLQRWKRATVINHLTGHHAYKGDLACINEAIERLKGSDVGRRIVELGGGGMKLYVSVYRAGDKEALRAKASANVFREGDPLAELIRKAQQMARHGFGNAEICEAIGKSEATIERYLEADPDKPKERKTRGKAKRPSANKVKAAALLAADACSDEVRVVLDWVTGQNAVDDKEFYRVFPGLKPKKRRQAA